MRVLINDVPANSLATVGWVHTTGASPYIGAYELDAVLAGPLFASDGPATIILDDLKQGTIENLSIIGEGISSAPMYRTVLVADLRWRWSRKWITGRYNIRRKTGQKTLVIDSLQELAQIGDEFRFLPGSLNGNSKWTPTEVVHDVLRRLRAAGDFTFEVDPLTDKLEVNDLELNDKGDVAIALVMRQLPGVSLWVDRTGKVIVQNSLSRDEAEVLDQAGPEIVGGGHVSNVSYRFTRPKKIIVYFTREQEVRIDSKVESDGSVVRLTDERQMENVVQVTDPEVLIGGSSATLGSWVTFEDVFPYWNGSKAIASAFDMSHTLIQASFFEDGLYNVFVPWGGDNAQPIWIGRIGATKRDYRQTYLINRRWMDRFWKITATRAALYDPVNNIRGRAQAFCDYCVRISTRYVGKNKNEQFLFKNETGYAALLKDASVSPAIVNVLDDQVGIIRLDFKTDLYGVHKDIYPSKMINLPTANIGDANTRGLGIKVGMFGNFPKLAGNHRVAIVLTAIPSMPNSTDQYFKVEVTPEDVVGKVEGLDITPAEGPDMEVHTELVTARMAWLDDASAVIERSFGIGLPNPPDPQQQAADQGTMEQLVVNRADVQAVAESIAAVIWSKMTDRWIGSKSVRFDPDLRIEGAITDISHELSIGGGFQTKISLPEELADRDVVALLPAHVRKIIKRELP